MGKSFAFIYRIIKAPGSGSRASLTVVRHSITISLPLKDGGSTYYVISTKVLKLN